jgi:diguanylate cyclase (GGDEF)-like protein
VITPHGRSDGFIRTYPLNGESPHDERFPSTSIVVTSTQVSPTDEELYGGPVWRLRALGFQDPELERQFLADDWREILPFFRMCAITGALLWALFGVLDFLFARQDLTTLWVIRFGVGLPALLISFGLSYVPSIANRLQIIGFGMGSLCAYCIIAMVAFTNRTTSDLYYVGVILVVIYVYTFAIIRFAYAIPFGLSVFVTYELAVFAINGSPIPIAVNNTVFVVSSIYIGVLACYTMERYRRKEFLHKRTIERERRKLMELSAKLEELSVHDPLTGLFSRRQLSVHLHDAVDQHRRVRTPASVMLIDLDDFKGINDRFGHLAGDELLKRTASLILDFLRKTDRAYRHGGDEFLVLLPYRSLPEAKSLADRLVSRFGGRTPESTHFATVCGISVGVASLSGSTHSPDDLLFAADRALYKAKQVGKGCVVAGGAG